MEIPNAYLQSLPKDCLGEVMYRYLTADQFSPECLLDYFDLSSEYTALEIANRVEASVHIWKHKYLNWHSLRAKVGKSASGGKVKGFVSDIEKTKVLAERAETLLQNLRLRFPCLPQTLLDMSKIQHNKDVGQSILESYSRVMESLAFNITARIGDLLMWTMPQRNVQLRQQSPSLFMSRGGLMLVFRNKVGYQPILSHFNALVWGLHVG